MWQDLVKMKKMDNDDGHYLMEMIQILVHRKPWLTHNFPTNDSQQIYVVSFIYFSTNLP